MSSAQRNVLLILLGIAFFELSVTKRLGGVIALATGKNAPLKNGTELPGRSGKIHHSGGGLPVIPGGTIS